MKIHFSSLIAILFMTVNIAQARVTVGNTYPMGTDKDKTFQTCTEIEGEEVGYTMYCPVPQEALNYNLELYGWDHGVTLTVKESGSIIHEDQTFGQVGNSFEYELPNTFEPQWATWGIANGVFEWRWNQSPSTPKKYHAIIYRNNFTSFAAHSGDPEEWEVSSQTSTLTIFSLNDNTIYGKVDSVRAWRNGENANELAQSCADSMVGLGDIQDCSKYYPAAN